MHLTDKELETLADGELGSPFRDAAHSHLAACVVCREALKSREARNREVRDLLLAIDHAPRVPLPDLLIARATRTRRSRWPSMAAGIAAVSLAAVAAAAAVPGLPLRAYLGRLVRIGRAAPPVHQSPESGAASVGFTPASVVNVIFTSPQRSGEIGITLSDSPLVRIAHRSGTVSYVLTADGVRVENEGSRASYEVTVPRTVSVHIRVSNRVIFARDGDRFSTLTSPDGEGRFLVRFAALAALGK